MKTLIITAHPSSRGFTHKIAEAYKKGANENGKDVEIIDLYKTELKQEYLQFEFIKEISNDKHREIIQSKIKEADELVFVHPLWWFSMPAIMKNFIDTNITAGFAYKFKKVPIIGGVPSGLLKGKIARVFITSDGIKTFYYIMLRPFYMIWRFGILGICGIKLKSLHHFDKMRWRNEKEKEGWLKKVRKIAK